MIACSKFHEDDTAVPDYIICLPFESREKSRLRATTTTGKEVAIIVPRGTVLKVGQKLLSENGKVIQIQAEKELVTTVYSGDQLKLTRLAYHLGNRHVRLQIGPGWLRYSHDHVLDSLARTFGVDVHKELATFEPEFGAYSTNSSESGHSHVHGNEEKTFTIK